MPPRRTRDTDLGALFRNARRDLHLKQSELAELCGVSTRNISRWENGIQPKGDPARRVLQAFARLPAPQLEALATALDVSAEDRDTLASTPPSPGKNADDLRATLDAALLQFSEAHKVLPGDLRAFGKLLLDTTDRLGLSAREAATLLAPTK